MDWIKIIVLIGAAMLIGGIVGAIVAGIKNRDLSFWTAFGFLFPPAVLLLAVLPRIKGRRPRRTTLEEEDTMMDQI